MRFRLFCHSLISDWNHGNAHFLRGIVTELAARGHDVQVYEPEQGWSLTHLLEERGASALDEFRRAFPTLTSTFYREGSPDVDQLLDGADVVVVHEWTRADVLAAIAAHHTRHGGYALLFHDTHHRAVSSPDALASLPLEHFDGVLAFGASLADQYRRLGWGRRVWVWHEAADTRIFQPHPRRHTEGDLIWIGNWGDDERTRELDEFLLRPVERLGLHARVHGVRYPSDAQARLAAAGIDYAGWVPNHQVPGVYARFRITVHVPRQPYVRCLPGIPTIRPFEALACGIPLVSAPWSDEEGLFRPGDFLAVRSTGEMTAALGAVLDDRALYDELVSRGLETIRTRHTCAHRVDELLAIVASLRTAAPSNDERTSDHVHTVGQRKTGAPGGAASRSDREAGSVDDESSDKALPSREVRRGGAMRARVTAAFFGSSILSAYWNGAATYYRGIVRELHRHGVDVTFFEPDAYQRQQHRDLDPPAWVTSVVYPATAAGVEEALARARSADFVVKTSGVGVFDELLERAVPALAPGRSVFWDVDAPATLARLARDPGDPFHALIPQYALVFTYGGGPAVVDAYRALGARECVPVYNGLDPQTHHPASPEDRFAGDLNLLVNRLPDRDARVDEFFLRPARRLPTRQFTLGGSGWEDKEMPANVRKAGHVFTADHNAFNCSPLAVLSVNREDMARTGYSPATRIFEAAGAGACLMTDAWTGVEQFFEPGLEILTVSSGDEVVEHLVALTPERARRIGEAACRRARTEHTYAQRVIRVLEALGVDARHPTEIGA